MKQYKVEYLPEAQQDIEEIRDYITDELNNKPAAIKITLAIIAKCESLKTFPNGYAIRFHSHNQPIRFAHYGNYTIAFFVDAAATVSIYAVKYSRMNLEAILKT